MTRRFLVLAAMLLLAAPPAFAHAMLRAADPAVGSTVKSAPKEVTLTFSESVDPSLSHVEVTDAQGARVDTGSLRLDPANPNRLVVALKPLIAGIYTVTWHAVSTDTHKTQGKFTFTMTP
jgi:copper resistance protein C